MPAAVYPCTPLIEDASPATPVPRPQASPAVPMPPIAYRLVIERGWANLLALPDCMDLAAVAENALRISPSTP